MGGDKPRRYSSGRTSPVGAGFIPARKGLNVESALNALKALNIQLPMPNVEMRLKQSKKMRGIK
jgi:hypothetical protein